MRWLQAIALVAVVGAFAPVVDAADDVIEAKTGDGDRVRLFPNGRWEYVDARKAEAQRPAVEAYEEAKSRDKSLEQGGLFGIGRKVRPGDPEYNRGSLGGKSR